MDPSQAADSDPESWDEQPERDGGEDKYLAQRPPHHGTSSKGYQCSKFREFITRGNVIDLAVAVVIGGAFTALVTVFTRSLIQPLINLALGGGVDGGKVVINGQVLISARL